MNSLTKKVFQTISIFSICLLLEVHKLVDYDRPGERIRLLLTVTDVSTSCAIFQSLKMTSLWPPPSPLPGYNFKRMRLLLLWKIKKWEENHLKEHHILFGGFGINTMRKIIWGPCVDKRAMWDSAPWLVQVVCCNGLTMMRFNTNSVEAEGQCKRL